MHISLNTLSFGNSQPLRFGCGKKKPCFKNVDSALNCNGHADYKNELERTKAELDYTQKKYDVLSNVFALYLNPKFHTKK